MSDFKVNPKTGQIAVSQPDGSWAVYEKGQYKTNPQGQIAVPAQGGWQILSQPQQAAAPNPIDQGLEQFAGPPGSGGSPDVSVYGAAGEGLIKGGGMGWADELGAAGAAALEASRPEFRGMQAGRSAYQPSTFSSRMDEGEQFARAKDAAAAEAHPIAYGAGTLAGSLPSALALPSRTGLQAAGSGAVGGSLFMAGASDAPTLEGRIKAGLGGAAFGGALGAGGSLIGKAIASNMPTGIASKVIDDANPSGLGALVARTQRIGLPPAAIDPVLADVLKTAATKNPKAAVQAIPGAKAGMAAANQKMFDQIDTLLSPENGPLLQQAIKDAAKGTNSAAYLKAYATNEGQGVVGMLPEDSARPVIQEALEIAQKLASNEKPPRTVDPGNLTAVDLDVVQRTLGKALEGAKMGTASTVDKMLVGPRGDAQQTVMDLINAAAPDLAKAEIGAKEAFKLRAAVDSGTQWFRPSKAPAEVADEFAKMTPNEQQAALSGFATSLKNVLGTKNAKANLSLMFEKLGLKEKLESLGFPARNIDEITAGGQGARNVLDSLQGGSDTARKLSAAKSLDAPIGQIRNTDILTAGLFKNPMLAAILPGARALGDKITESAAGHVVRALTDPQALVDLARSSPQAYRQLLMSILQASGRPVSGSLPGVK